LNDIDADQNNKATKEHEMENPMQETIGKPVVMELQNKNKK
jgi:hypothetical protein